MIQNEAVYISLDEGAELPARLDEFERKINNCFYQNRFNIVIDLKNIKLPPTTFIVILIKSACQARRMGGDVKIINLNTSIRSNLVTFSPRTYLSIESSESYALYDFGETFRPQNEFDISENVSILAHQDQKTAADRPHEPIAGKYRGDSDILKDATLARDHIRVASKVDNLYQICDFVLERAEQAGFDLRERGKIKVTVYEACLNVVEHAYFSNPDHWIDVYVGFDEQVFVIVIQDSGESFDFDPTRPYDVEQAVKDRRTGGFGLHIIRRSVDKIDYISDPEEGNRLILVKFIKTKE